MRAFGQKQNQPQKQVSSSFARSNAAILGPNHHANSLLHLQRTIGNQAVQGMLQTHAEELEGGSAGRALPRFGYDFSRIPIHPPSAGAIQSKLATNQPGDEVEQEADRVAAVALTEGAPEMQAGLAIGASNDPLEQEADRVADQVLAAPATPAVSGAPPHIQRFKGQPGTPTGTAPASIGRLLASPGEPPTVRSALADPGRPLDSASLAYFQSGFGHDLSTVRLHTGDGAAASAASLSARAYTVGRHIVLGRGAPCRFRNISPAIQTATSTKSVTPPLFLSRLTISSRSTREEEHRQHKGDQEPVNWT